MIMSEVVSNRVRFSYDDQKDGESFEIYVINDDGEKLLCRGNAESCIDGKNFFELIFQFMQKSASRKAQKSQISTAQMVPPGGMVRG